MAPIATMTVRLSAQIAEFQSEFRNATKSAEQFANSFEGIATRAAAIGTFIGNIATRIASSLASAFGQGIRDAIKLSSEFSNAFLGLSSVARAFGADADAAKAAAQRLSSDGLLPLKDSAAGLKNLLATGFSLDQSVQLMNAFKDAAAFGRAGALSFGDAIRTATEGVKNGNSILVDNAGITKNLSQILKEAGFSAQDLSRASSDAGVRLALFNGILKESAAFAGDAARLTQTYSGQIARLDTAYKTVLATIGTAITQNATVARALGAVGDALVGLNTNLVSNRNAFNLVSEGVILFVKAISGVVTAVDVIIRAVNLMDTALKTVVNGFANAGKAIADVLVGVVTLATKLPGGAAALGLVGDEVRSLAVAQKLLGDLARSSAQDISDNSARVQKWGGILGGVKGDLGKLIVELEATRGKTVQLGDATGSVGRAFKATAGESSELSKALDKLSDKVNGVKLVEQAKLWATALKIPGAEAKVLGDTALRRDLIKALDAVEDHFGSLKNAGVGSLEGIRGAAKALEIASKPLANIPIKFEVKGLDALGGSGFQSFKPNPLGEIIPFPEKTSLAAPLIERLQNEFDKIDADTLRATEAIRRVKAGMQREIEAGDKPSFLSKFLADFGKTDLGVEAHKAAQNVIGSLADAIRTGDFSNFAGQIKRAIADFMGSAIAAGINFLVPGLGTLLQPLLSALSEQFINIFSSIFDQNKGRDLIKDFAASFGGFDAFRKELIDKLGPFNAEKLFAQIAKVGRNNATQAQEAIDSVEAALKRAEDAFGRLASVVNDRAAIFGRAVADMKGDVSELAAAIAEATRDGDSELAAGLTQMQATTRDKIAALEPEFNRISDFALAAFSGLVRHGSSAIDALRDLEPTLAILSDAMSSLGFAGNAAIQKLLGIRDFVAANKDFVDAISADQAILQAFGDSGILTRDLFQSVATDIGAQFQHIIDNGGDMATALALSQPVLQRLWEAQQIYGKITDETTQKILQQAEEQGIVGAHMKDVNQKILDVLIAIADVFGAKLPASLRQTSDQARTTARDIENSLGNIRVRPITIDIEYNDPGFDSGTRVPALAGGGIVRRPTLALVGEAGPEAVVPLSSLSNFSQPSSTTVILEMDSRQVAEAVVPVIPGVVQRYGLVHNMR